MNAKPEYDQIKNLLTSTVRLLCKNGVPFTRKLHVEALVGVTIDTNDVFFVHISETIPNDDPAAGRESSPDDSSHSTVKMSPQMVKAQRSGPPSRAHSPVGYGGSPRSGSPAMMKQQRNGTVMGMSQQQQQLHHQQQQQHFMMQQQQKFQQQQRLQQQQARPGGGFPMVNKQPLRQQTRTLGDSDDVMVVKQEGLWTPDTGSQKTTMMGGQRRPVGPTAFPTPPSNVTVIEPVTELMYEDGLTNKDRQRKALHVSGGEGLAGSMDDAEAMQKSYLAGNPDDQPPTKRPCLDPTNSSTGFRPQSNTSAAGGGRMFSAGGGSQWGISDTSSIPPHPVTYSDPASRTIQAFPGCSTWASPTSNIQGISTADMIKNQGQRGFKNPRNNTMCQPVRDVLEFNLAQPVMAEAHEVSAFRLFWRSHDTVAGWRNIIYNRLELDAIVAEYPGVSFFISTITATARDPKTIMPTPNDPRLRAYPALGYWIVSRDPMFDRHLLMKKLSEAAEGGELKTMLHNDGEKVNEVGALNLIIKDYGKGYVQQRVQESASVSCGPGEEHPTIRFILKEDHFEAKLREAVDLLAGVGCPVSLEKVDMEAFGGEGEDKEQAQDGEDQMGNMEADQTGNLEADQTGNMEADQSGNMEMDQTGNVETDQTGNVEAFGGAGDDKEGPTRDGGEDQTEASGEKPMTIPGTLGDDPEQQELDFISNGAQADAEDDPGIEEGSDSITTAYTVSQREEDCTLNTGGDGLFGEPGGEQSSMHDDQ